MYYISFCLYKLREREIRIIVRFILCPKVQNSCCRKTNQFLSQNTRSLHLYTLLRLWISVSRVSLVIDNSAMQSSACRIWIKARCADTCSPNIPILQLSVLHFRIDSFTFSAFTHMYIAYVLSCTHLYIIEKKYK